MKIKYEPREIEEGVIEPAHYVEQVCVHCGYDLDQDEINAETCADCGEALTIKQSVAIEVTTLPSVFGETM